MEVEFLVSEEIIKNFTLWVDWEFVGSASLVFFQGLPWHVQEQGVTTIQQFTWCPCSSRQQFSCVLWKRSSLLSTLTQSTWQSQGVIKVWLPPHVWHLHQQRNIRFWGEAGEVQAPLLFSYYGHKDEKPRRQREHMVGACNGLNHSCEIHQSSFC